MAQNPNYENYEQEIYNSDAPADGYSQGYPDNDGYDEAPDGEDVKTGEADISEIAAMQTPKYAPADPFPFPLTSVIPEGMPQFADNADIDPTPYIKRKPVKKNMDEDKMPRFIAWADAWRWTKSHYPAACYEYLTSAGGTKKYRESDYGVVVGIYLSLDGEKFFRCVELPVLDSHNMSRKPYPYKGTNTYDKFTVAPPDESDLNKAQKRCLTKAIAEVTGFGIRLWGKDDAPNNIRKASVAPEMIADVREKLPLCNLKEQTVVAMVNNQNFGNIQTLDELTANAYVAIMGMLTRKLMQVGQTGNSAMKPSPAAKPEPAQAPSPAPQAAPVQEAAPAPQEKPANEQPKPRTRTAKPAQKPTAKPAPAEKPAPTAQPTQPAPAQPVETAAPVEKPAPAPVQNAAPTPAPVQKPAAQAAPVQKPAPQAAPIEKPAPQAAPIEKPAPAKEAVPAQAENTDPFDNPFAGFDDFNPDEFGFDM